LKQGNWRNTLKLRVFVQIIAAITSIIAAIHQLLKKSPNGKGVLLVAMPSCIYDLQYTIFNRSFHLNLTEAKDNTRMRSLTRTPLRTARTGMVASANPLASLIGVEILRAGGNAIDAAVAMGAALAVMEPHNSQLGGDVFAQIWDAPARKLTALNGSGAAPQGATLEAMGGTIPERGIRAAAVPGAVDAWLAALETWGTRTASEVLAPAIALAEDGYALPAWQADLLRMHEALWEEYPESGAALVPDDLRPGATLYQPTLARTLRAVAEGGRAAFYEGEFAEKLVAYSEENSGFFTRDDLAGHRSQILEPLRTTYRGIAITEQPPVSQGCLLLQMLNILEGYDLAALDPEGPEAVHLMAEAKKLAFADRLAYLGDVPSTPLDTLLSKEYAAQQRKRINLASAAARYSPGRLPSVKGGSDTTSLCVIDARGNAVSWIQSVFQGYGSGVVVPGTGVLLNNRMTGFSLDPKSPNVLAPGKRTMHTLNTWMAFREDELWAVGGTPGGDVQVQTNLQTLTQMIDWGRTPQEAIESPKWQVPPDGPELVVEDRLPLDTCYELRQRGHHLNVVGPWAGSCASQIITLDSETGTLFGGSDPRADGLALGY
jgi:gamma-glutamyltranspeptidase/glutathione hydrolase